MSLSRIEQIKSFLEQKPNDPFLHFALALEHLKLDDSATAKAIFNQLLQEQPDYVGTYYHLGKLLEQEKAYEQAFEVYQKGIATATRANDRHAAQELRGAYQMLSDELL
ncbi:MAG: hypothetical protein JNM36_01665 [Chitinophagales bacterium]|jgi:tetratricopeptide (TPR) repeat protein|nr:hypothetical protein [Chitinophagales bacterium]HNI43274.1 hypothetical protein [Chitinophagales bacterium]HNL06082.1 hypothetical protein [Chitinophagales bacterium]